MCHLQSNSPFIVKTNIGGTRGQMLLFLSIYTVGMVSSAAELSRLDQRQEEWCWFAPFGAGLHHHQLPGKTSGILSTVSPQCSKHVPETSFFKMSLMDYNKWADANCYVILMLNLMIGCFPLGLESKVVMVGKPDVSPPTLCWTV